MCECIDSGDLFDEDFRSAEKELAKFSLDYLPSEHRLGPYIPIITDLGKFNSVSV